MITSVSSLQAPTLLNGPIAILGAGGQIGTALVQLLGPIAAPIFRQEADFTHPDQVIERLETLSPMAVINAAAYTAVDKAEADPAAAQIINALTPAAVAHYCRTKDIPLIHFSTDYVYDGSKQQPWVETDTPDPLNMYGHTKLAGDLAILATQAKALIFRTCWVYADQGQNFFLTILKHAQTKAEIRVVDDQIGSPSYAPHLARAALAALAKAFESKTFPTGIYHLANEGYASWHAFATMAVERARALGMPTACQHLVPISSDEYPTPAKRPRNSCLNTSKFHKQFGIQLPHWMEGAEEALQGLMKEWETSTLQRV